MAPEGSPVSTSLESQSMASDGSPDAHPDLSANVEDRRITTIVVLYAMEAEARPLIQHLQLIEPASPIFPSGAPWLVYSGSHDGATVHVVQPGKDKTTGVDNVGTVPASLATYAAIEVLKPDLIINAGTSGGFKAKEAEIGNVFLAKVLLNHDRRIPLPGFDEYGVGAIVGHAAPNLIKHLEGQKLTVKVGNVSTGNSFDCPPVDLEKIKQNGAAVKDMEGAAVAWVAGLFSIPMLAVKVITDIVDGTRPTNEEFLENLHEAADVLKRTVPEVITFVSGKKMCEL